MTCDALTGGRVLLVQEDIAELPMAFLGTDNESGVITNPGIAAEDCIGPVTWDTAEADQ